MLRWSLLLLSLIAFAVTFQTRSPGLLGLSLVVAVFSLAASFLSFASARMQRQAQEQAHRETTMIALTRGKVAPPRPPAASARAAQASPPANTAADRGLDAPDGSD